MYCMYILYVCMYILYVCMYILYVLYVCDAIEWYYVLMMCASTL